jgi:hypothetical protein
MSQSNFPRFRPALESLDVRAMPAPLLMQVCASGVPASADVGQTLDLKATSSGGETKGDVKPVADSNGKLWLCREGTWECVEWPG